MPVLLEGYLISIHAPVKGAITTGQSDFYGEMRNTLKQYADSGIRTKYAPLKGSAGKAVDYASGYSRRLDSAVRQNLLWGIKQCNQGVQERVGESFGSDGWEIDYHPHPRPSHAPMGGMQYAAGDTGKIIDGVYYPPFSDVEDLLDDYGCLHRKWPIICGVSEPNHSPEELAKLKADDEKKIEFEGREYTKYELSQIQRKLETAARHAKDRQIIAKAAGDDELRRQEQAKVNLITSKYAKLSKAAGLPTRAERMSVSKYAKVKTLGEIAKTVLTTGKNSANIKLDNKTVRQAYKEMVASIANKINKTKPVEAQARQAFGLRNQYRTNARDLMKDTSKRKELDRERPSLSFEELLESKMLRKGLTRDEALKDILKTASTSNENVNRELGL